MRRIAHKVFLHSTQGVPALQHPHEIRESERKSGVQSIEDLTNIEFSSPNYCPVPSVRNTALPKARGSVLTSTPIPNEGLGQNISDLTHNRGKANIINSFTNAKETEKKSSKGGMVKNLQITQPKTKPPQAQAHRLQAAH